jgi:hypothetical protein
VNGCYFLTWNLGGNTRPEHVEGALELLVGHLLARGTCIAALQEARRVTGATIRQLVENGSNGALLVAEQTLGETVLLLHSRDLRSHDIRPYARMTGATFGGDVWGGVQVLGVHLRDRMIRQEGQERGVDAVGWQRDFLRFWRGGPLIVLGDFNADPYHSEVCARAGGFFGLRDRDTLDWRGPVLDDDGVPRLPLYNPMWAHLAEKTDGAPRGTLNYANPRKGIGSWCYDQILVSRDLVDGLGWGPGIWAKMEGRSLVT